MIYIGAEEIISPLGTDAEANFSALTADVSGISLIPGAGFNNTDLHLAKIQDLNPINSFENLVVSAFESISERIDESIIRSDRTLILLSSTKGGLYDQIEDPFRTVTEILISKFKLTHTPVVISNACISGVLAINTAGNVIKAGLYDHVIVIGCDVVTDFVVYGFQSLFAISDQPCKPFDQNRTGVTLGEACSAVLVSNEASVFKQKPYTLLTGTSANDANHISGPSRTGEGLFRSVKRTLDKNGVRASEIDFISAHGTGTLYNDEMESIAMDRLGLAAVPLNSFKGYFGHTLGAAGVLETAVCLQMLHNSMLVKSRGFTDPGTSIPLNIVTETQPAGLKMILKTASGFGGGNASLLIRE
ncbi:MAG TPA: beta-ketoacyl synthase N-terminal-like domain-containing protein [Dyadobacter sp.]|nr:beta-ketoacyl synthase N-terminal-like domain-containing protein [Dyadobacter sp.]